MINKIKDFLKNKLKRKASGELSDQDDWEEIPTEDQRASADQTGSYQIESADDHVESTLKQEAEEERTGSFQVSIAPEEEAEIKPSFKERIQEKFSGLKERIGNINIPKPKINLTEVKLPARLKSKGDGAPLLSPNIINAIEKLVSRQGREPIHQIFLVLLVVSLTYSLSKITALALKGNPTVEEPRDYAVSIPLDKDFNAGSLVQVKNINVFRTNTGLTGKKKVAETRCDKAQQASNLPIKLVNTIVLQDSVKSLASVQVRGDRNLQEVREGEQISNLAQIFKITRLEILVRNLENGVCESIASDKLNDRRRSPISVMTPAQSRQYLQNKKMPGIENQGNKFSISKTLLDEKMKDIASILTQTRAIPIQNPDGTIAFKLTETDPEGIFPYLGLQDQDIITSINGQPIYSMNEVMTLFGRIRNLDNLSLGIRREGAEVTQEYSIKK